MQKIKLFFFFLSSVVNNNWNLKMNFGLTKVITVNTIMIIDYIVVVYVITYYIEQKQEYKYLTTCHSIIINLWLNRIRSDRRAVCNMEFATMAQPKFLCSTWFSKSLKRPATKQRSTCIYEWDDKSSKGFFQKKNCNSFTCTHHTRFMFQKWNVKYKSGSKMTQYALASWKWKIVQNMLVVITSKRFMKFFPVRRSIAWIEPLCLK